MPSTRQALVEAVGLVLANALHTDGSGQLEEGVISSMEAQLDIFHH
jgi:hypothetical protein